MKPLQSGIRFGYLILLSVCFALLMILFWQLGLIELGVALSVGVATVTAIVGWNLSNQIQIRRELEVKKSIEFLERITKYLEALSWLSSDLEYAQDDIVINEYLHGDYQNIQWSKLYISYGDKIMKRLNTVTDLSPRNWIPANEIVVVELERYYARILNTESNIAESIRKIHGENAMVFTNIQSRQDLTNVIKNFDKPLKELKELQDWCDDLARLCQNHFLSSIFQRVLINRRPSTDVQKLEDTVKKTRRIEIKKLQALVKSK